MIQANWFIVVNKFGNFIVGRTDAPPQVNRSAFMPDGTPGIMIVAPPHFVEGYRIRYFSKHGITAAQLLDRQYNLLIYKQALLTWEDCFKASLLKSE